MLQSLSQEERDKVMASLFAEEGVRFSLGRTPVACSDYSFGYYSYNDVKDDYTMRNFSIDRDRFLIVFLLLHAKSYMRRVEIHNQIQVRILCM